MWSYIRLMSLDTTFPLWIIGFQVLKWSMEITGFQMLKWSPGDTNDTLKLV
jgi:hypothetical protein